MKHEKEYLMLRNEIIWRLKVVDTLGTFTYTVFISILGVAISTNIIELFLLPFIVVVPISLKVANHKYGVAYVAGYLNEFLEDLTDENCFKWEKFHVKYYNENPRELKEKIIYYGSNAEYLLICVLTSILFWIKYLSGHETYLTVVQVFGYSFIQLASIFLVTYATINYSSFQKFKPSILLKWKKVNLNSKT